KVADSLRAKLECNKAIETYNQSVDMCNRLIKSPTMDTAEKANCLYGIGCAYDFLNDYDKAIDFKTKSLEMYTRLHLTEIDHNDIASLLVSLGGTYSLMKQFEKAIEYQTKS